MQRRLILTLATLIFVALLNGTIRQSYGFVLVSQPENIEVGGRKAVLQIVLLKGGRVFDEAPSAMCRERIEGVFAARVKFENGKYIDTPLNNLMKFNNKTLKKLTFCAKTWRIFTADYNKDDQIDFNLGEFGTSNGWIYWLFTISPSGQVSLLPTPDDCIFLADFKNSTDKIQIGDEGIKYVSFANVCDKVKDCGWWETTYRWNQDLKRFERLSSSHLNEYTPEWPREE